MIRVLAIAGLALMATACATDGIDGPAAANHRPPPLTPTEQFSITVTPHRDQILLAGHPDGLSAAQAQALSDLVGRWRDGGRGVITIQSPSGGAAEAYRSAAVVQQTLLGLGVGPDQIRLASYDASRQSAAPIAVGYDGYEARGPECGRHWSGFTRSSANRPSAEFGCATTANVAAMIANPGDLVQPRAEDSADADRRLEVLGKYRQGQVTSTAKDPQANGAVSDIGQ